MKYKSRDHPAVKSAKRMANKEIKKAKHKFEKKLAQNIKQDSSLFLRMLEASLNVKLKLEC